MQQLRQNNLINEIVTQIQSLPPLKTEESILLRILVQTLVIVGIIATDIASFAATNDLPMSVWAIPLSIIGAVVSWRRRKERNIGLKFCLAIAMIATLVIFLGNLLESLFDNRLVLAEFLVQLQVIHSFDLPRRKDLGYSMVIGLILIGVAGTLSQTLAFAPWLILFFLIAIPTMILDYRSRMGLPTWETEWRQNPSTNNQRKQLLTNSALSPRKLGQFLIIASMLGLLIFAVMPRYQGYKLQTFPVKAPPGLEKRTFSQEGNGIVNPGYDRDGNANGSNLMGENGENNGESDDFSYYGFNTKINQSEFNKITKKKILLRIRSQSPGFWRVLAFDKYTGQGWEISRDAQTVNLRREPWNYRFNLPLPPIRGEMKRIIQTYTVAYDLPNIIPVLSNPEHLYFPTNEIAIDPEGSLRSPAGLIEGLTYTVISKVPHRSRTQLRTASNQYHETIEKYYLSLPPEIKDNLKNRAEELLAKSTNDLDSNYEKALYLAQAIKQNYTINPNFVLLTDNQDLTDAFFMNGGGFPDHFATVYTLMLRSLGIPARLVVGFAPGQFNPFTGYYLVHNTDAHAMTEVYFPDYGWFYFDPLPGHEIVPLSFEEDQTFGILKRIWQWVASWLPSPITGFITILFTTIFKGITNFLSQDWLSELWYFVTGSFIGILVGILGLILLAFLMWLAWQGLQKLFYRRQLAKMQPMAKLYQEMLDLLKEKGFPKHPAQTPLEYCQYLTEFLETEQLNIIQLISDNYTAWRYGNQIPNLDYLRSQFQLLKKGQKVLTS